MSAEAAGGDAWHDYAGTALETTGAASVAGGVFSGDGATWLAAGGAGNSYVPLSFRYGAGGGAAAAASVRWLVSDQLGTPRTVLDQSGSLAGVKRHDYLPFGEEIVEGVGGRTITQGYSQVDNVRQKFTSKERDSETGLDYFGARYYTSAQGRFTSCDPIITSEQHVVNPQRWNAYTYVLNSPLSLVDPDGRNGKGSGGGRVIDVYLTHRPHERGSVPNGQKYRGENWKGLIERGKTRDVVVNVHYLTDRGNGDSEPTAGKITKSLSTPGRFVVIAGHSITDEGASQSKGKNVGDAIFAGNGYIGKNGVETSEGQSPLPEIKAKAVFVNTCDVSGVLPSLTANLSKGSTLIYNDAGPDGLTGIDANERAAYAQAQVLVNGGSVNAAMAAGQKRTDVDQEPMNKGDKLRKIEH